MIFFFEGDISFHSGDSYFGKNLTSAVRSGQVNEDRVTDMAMRIVAAWYKVIYKNGALFQTILIPNTCTSSQLGQDQVAKNAIII